MRTLIAILMLTASALPLRAAEWKGLDYSGTASLRPAILEFWGNQSPVREYDGKRYNGGEADVSFNTSGKGLYLDLFANDLYSGDESGFVNMNVGSMEVTGKVDKLTHRVSYVPTGIIMNGEFYQKNNYRLNPTALQPFDPLDTPYYDASDGSGLRFNRTESDVKASFTCPKTGNYRVYGKVWDETEQGHMVAKNSGRIGAAEVNRQTTDLTVGADAAIGKTGAVAYDYTQGTFNDDAKMIIISTTGSFYNLKPFAPNNETKLHNLSFRYVPVAGYNVNGAATSRVRNNLNNGFRSRAYTATLGASHQFGKKLNVTIKSYGHTEMMDENDGYRFMTAIRAGSTVPITPKKTADGTMTESQIDRYELKSDLLARYDLSDKIGLKAGYRVANSYRRHAEAEVFTPTNTYQGGGYVASGEQFNGVAEKNTAGILTLGMDFALPLEAELGVGYKGMRSNKAIMETYSTVSDEYSADLSMPLYVNDQKSDISLVASAMYSRERNAKSNHTRTSSHEESAMTGLEWAGSGSYTAGADYSYDRRTDRGDMYLSGYTTPTDGMERSLNGLPIRVLNSLYRYTDNVIGVHATAKINKEFALAGDSSYTRSVGTVPVQLRLPVLASTDNTLVSVTDLGPQEVRITRSAVSLKYTPVKYQNMSAKLGLRRDHWNDKVDSYNNGWVNVAELTLSTKF